MMHFWMLFRKEVEQNYQWVIGAAAIVLLVSLVIQFQIKETEGRIALSMLLLLLPFLDGLLKGFYQIRNEYARNTHYFLRSLPTSGLHILASKYLWLALEVTLLTIMVMVPISFFILNSSSGAFQELVQVLQDLIRRNQMLDVLKFATAVVLFVLPFPVIAYFSQLVGQRIGRVEWLISGITYLGILWLQGTIYNALGFFDQSSDVSMLGMQISSNREVITLDPQYVIFQITLSALLLLISGWMFDQQDL
ncbi:hypothetical protein [Deinococcus cellulosilyticus]|uniref:ABC transporter permease n=1 Tax=Deinococcus cellulosilyticus (strain DSM 18568 / NBRC 106333 / KACC 11606 / 5516J-15) TaxID=1223518 RepID=A0A511N5C9_DEIC1|nr:hypothetical protein [Deinococcus cellulosilyticus]GEM47687.1 hypothetical protein DC3_33220 [Deinococcus cellulosilyticus NBRC 106333 = KACC 11606]